MEQSKKTFQKKSRRIKMSNEKNMFMGNQV